MKLLTGYGRKPDRAPIAWDEKGRLMKATMYVQRLYVALHGARANAIPQTTPRRDTIVDQGFIANMGA